VIPVAAMGVSYSLMSHVLWRAKGIGELNQRQEESIQSKRKVSQFSFPRSVHGADCFWWQMAGGGGEADQQLTFTHKCVDSIHVQYCS